MAVRDTNNWRVTHCMDPVIKLAWRVALQSGDYPQGKYTLRYTTTKGVEVYCALGVLCELAVKARILGPPEPRIDGTYLYAGLKDTLPEAVIRWAGLPDAQAS